MAIKFGPAGIGGIRDAFANLLKYHKLGLTACEIAFTYGIYIKGKEEAVKLGNEAENLGIQLSIHAPYWINLNSLEKKKIHSSKKRILDCCKIGDCLNANKVVFHPGYYGKMEKEETYQNIKKEILEVQEDIKKNKWDIELAPETTGKINVFGSIEEIARLVKETGCSFCLDFAHILAREKAIPWEKIKKEFPGKKWHCHYSGIVFSEKGERNHKKTSKQDWENILSQIPKNKDITIINESPDPVKDSVLGLELIKGHL